MKSRLKDIKIISIYIPDNPKLVNQKLTELKGKIINSVVTVGNFHTSLSIQENIDLSECQSPVNWELVNIKYLVVLVCSTVDMSKSHQH